MAETKGVVGYGTSIQIGDGASPEVFTEIPEPKDITGPQLTQEFAEFTHQQSPGHFREYKPTFKVSGDVSFKCNYLPNDTIMQRLESDYANQTLRNFKEVFPTSPVETYAFHAYVSKFEISSPMAGPLEVSITLHITGPVTMTP